MCYAHRVCLGQSDVACGPGGQTTGNAASLSDVPSLDTALAPGVALSQAKDTLMWTVPLDESNVSVSSQAPGHPVVNLVSTDMTSFWESADFVPPPKTRPTVGSRVRIIDSGHRSSCCGVISRDDRDNQPYRVTFDGSEDEDSHWFHERDVEALASLGGRKHIITIALPSAAKSWELGHLRVYLPDQAFALDTKYRPQRFIVTAVKGDSQLGDAHEIVVPQVLKKKNGGGGRAPKVPTAASGQWLDVLGANQFEPGVSQFRIECSGDGPRIRLGKIELKLQSACLPGHVFEQIEEPGSVARVFSCANGFPLHVSCTDFGGMARPWHAKALLLRVWRKYIAAPDVSSRLQGIRERQAAKQREAGLLVEEESIAAADFEVVKALLAQRKFSEADQSIMQALRLNAVAKRDAEVTRKSEEHHAAVQAVLAASETHKLASKFRWKEAQTLEYANLRILLDRTVGLDSVKEWILQRLCDCAERAVCEDAFDRRHVLLAGGFGVGKRTATLLLVHAMKLLWSMSSPQPAAPAAAKVDSAGDASLDDLATVLTPQEGQSAFSGIDIQPATIYYVRTGAGLAHPKEMVDGRALRALTDAGSVVIISGESVHVDKFLALEQMCRGEPYHIDLPPLSLSSLARITLDLVRKRDLRLSPSIVADRMDGAGANASSPDATLLSALEYIVRQTYGAPKVVQHGGYLANEMLQVPCLCVLPLWRSRLPKLSLSHDCSKRSVERTKGCRRKSKSS